MFYWVYCCEKNFFLSSVLKMSFHCFLVYIVRWELCYNFYLCFWKSGCIQLFLLHSFLFFLAFRFILVHLILSFTSCIFYLISLFFILAWVISIDLSSSSLFFFTPVSSMLINMSKEFSISDIMLVKIIAFLLTHILYFQYHYWNFLFVFIYSSPFLEDLLTLIVLITMLFDSITIWNISESDFIDGLSFDNEFFSLLFWS